MIEIEFIKGKGFIAEVIRTGRKKTATVMVREGKVSVVVPKATTVNEVTALVTKKTKWIREKLLIQQQHPRTKLKEYVSGESFTYLGRNYHLKVQTGVNAVKLMGGKLVVQVPCSVQKRDQYVQGALTEWYRTHALEKLREKVGRFSEIVGVTPVSVGIKTFKGRWGSCSTKGDLMFNWRIIIAPNRIVDYVVAHELCHLYEHNHSPKFWKHVERVFPDYKESREWFKVNGRYLGLD